MNPFGTFILMKRLLLFFDHALNLLVQLLTMLPMKVGLGCRYYKAHVLGITACFVENATEGASKDRVSRKDDIWEGSQVACWRIGGEES
jgi:hypothetical protein